MIPYISAVNMDGESGSLVNIMVFDGKKCRKNTNFPSRESAV